MESLKTKHHSSKNEWMPGYVTVSNGGYVFVTDPQHNTVFMFFSNSGINMGEPAFSLESYLRKKLD